MQDMECLVLISDAFTATCLLAVSHLFTTILTSCRSWNKEKQTEQGELCIFFALRESVTSFIFVPDTTRAMRYSLQIFVSNSVIDIKHGAMGM